MRYLLRSLSNGLCTVNWSEILHWKLGTISNMLKVRKLIFLMEHFYRKLNIYFLSRKYTERCLDWNLDSWYHFLQVFFDFRFLWFDNVCVFNMNFHYHFDMVVRVNGLLMVHVCDNLYHSPSVGFKRIHNNYSFLLVWLLQGCRILHMN